MARTHGKASTYRSGACRCDSCRVANTERSRADRRSRFERLAADPGLAPHGSVYTYRNWGCRCAPCKRANVDACREYGRRRRARRAEP